MRLSEATKECLGGSLTGEASRASRFAREWPHLHTMCLGSVDHDIRQFTNHLDENVTQVVSYTSPILTGIKYQPGASFSHPAPVRAARPLRRRARQAKRIRHTLQCRSRHQDSPVPAGPGPARLARHQAQHRNHQLPRSPGRQAPRPLTFLLTRRIDRQARNNHPRPPLRPRQHHRRHRARQEHGRAGALPTTTPVPRTTTTGNGGSADGETR